MINHQEKVTLAIETGLYTFDLWVVEDAEKWSKISVSILPWKNLFGHADLRICGAIHTGEFIFVPHDWRIMYGDVSYHVVYYDHKRNEIRHRNVSFYVGNQSPHTYVRVRFFNYVESAMLL